MRIHDFTPLIQAVEDAAYQCGEWNSNHPGPFYEQHQRLTSAKAELRAAVAMYAKQERDHALDSVLETIRLIKSD